MNTRIRANRPLQESEVKQIAFQLLSAVRDCHQKKIVHRDIKPDNILIQEEEAAEGPEVGSPS